MISVLDKMVAPGRAVRSLQYDSDSELTYTGSGATTHASLSTNRGTLDCDIGTLAMKADGSATKWLTSSGWQDFI